jgi:hypothetical protein
MSVVLISFLQKEVKRCVPGIQLHQAIEVHKPGIEKANFELNSYLFAC